MNSSMKDRKLFLTRLDYDSNMSNAAAIASWCFPREVALGLEEAECDVLEYVTGKREAVVNANAVVSRAYERLIPCLARGMNEYHRTSFSSKYWKILLGFWFRQYLDNLYERYELLKYAQQEVPDSHVELIPLDKEWVARDTDDFSVAIFSDVLNHQLFGQIIRARKMFCYSDLDPLSLWNFEPLGRRPKSNLSNLLRRGAFIISCLLGKFNRIVLLRTHFGFDLLVKFALRYRSLPLLGTPSLSSNLVERDRDSRRALSGNMPELPSDFECLAMELVPFNVPEVYCEKFSDLTRLANWLRPRRARLFVTANAFAAYEVFKIWAAMSTAEDDKSRYVILQHGANYGQSEVMSEEEYEIDVADRYMTSGWTYPSNPKIDTSVGFSCLAGISDYKGVDPNFNPEGDIIWVLASLPRYHYTQWSAPQGPNFQYYLKDQASCLCNLGDVARLSVLCRAYHYDYGWRDLDYLTKCGGEFRIDRVRQPLRQMMKSARLMLFTYNSTAMMESMALNVPTLCYWDSELWAWRDSAQPLLDAMRDVSIFHECGEKAANFLNSMMETQGLMAWWSSKEVQTVRRSFCDQYARTPSEELGNWNRSISELGCLSG